MGLEVYDLVLLKDNSKIIFDTGAPYWLDAALGKYPFMVIRRGIIKEDSIIPIGVKGQNRLERFGCYTSADNIQHIIKPEHISTNSNSRFFSIINRLNEIFSRYKLVWGITGSVGYELATGIVCTHENSDIDIIIKPDNPFSPDIAKEIILQLRSFSIHIDAVIATDIGFVNLEEYSKGAFPYLLKMQIGECLVNNIWGE